MTNVEIIEKAKKANGIVGQVDTYEGWQRLGFQVQKGQKALFQTKIWKPITKKASSEDKETKETDEEGRQKMIMVKASFFGSNQVEQRA